MRKLLILGVMIFFASCSTNPPVNDGPVQDLPDQDTGEMRPAPSSGQRIKLWATYYYSKSVESSSAGIPLRNMQDQVIGPKLDSSTWCLGAIEGTVNVGNQTYNFAGTKSPKQANCSHNASSYVRWKKSPYKYGIGNRNNPLIPFKTIACDQGNVSGSRRWLNGGYMKYGQEIYVPEARGVKLPDGSLHDGYFQCGDVGGLIKGNHIDVFLGNVVGGDSGARGLNPFEFIKSRSSGTFDAYLVN